jgi:hypothetical protein
MVATQEKSKTRIVLDLWRLAEKWGEDEAIGIVAATIKEQAGIEVSDRNIRMVAMQLDALELPGLPYVHTRTFEGWRSAGRQVRKGEKSGIFSITWIGGGEDEGSRYPKVTNLFHLSQTDAIDGEDDGSVPPIAPAEERERTTAPREPRARKPRGKTAGLAVVQQGVEVSENKEKQGIEIRFAAKPSDAVLAELKAHGFRWSRAAGCWYAKISDSAKVFAYSLQVEE